MYFSPYMEIESGPYVFKGDFTPVVFVQLVQTNETNDSSLPFSFGFMFTLVSYKQTKRRKQEVYGLTGDPFIGQFWRLSP